MFSNGMTQDVTMSCVGWASDNAFVLSVGSSGLIVAHNSGSATVTATCQGVFAQSLITLKLN
jgi:hypothetical protein